MCKLTTRIFFEAMAWTSRARDVDQAEALALLKAMQWIKNCGLSKVIIEGDNKALMEAIRQRKMTAVKWEDKYLIDECLSLFQSMFDVEVSFVPRVCNKVADAMAKYARRNMCNQYWKSIPPKIIIPFLRRDMYDSVTGTSS
ncbi:hypothetical protein MKW98_010658 [Papaver atlanticum]|uniref:RNase H type-1 domain-containing protein n=1 Tax=Papaver atlanticum TaxID=357466 RepID=A0AAD4SIZ3_9MAGN|nr:hypothetical protein MKW98_010658 [Papaver atlanticum]